MKLLVIGDRARVAKYLPTLEVVKQVERIVVPRGTGDAEILALAADADFIMADAISPVSAELIAQMPNLKLIHSEGVAYNAIDVAAARTRKIPVCNCKGANARAVAEHAIMLMVACLHDAINGDNAVRTGRQIEMKERLMREGVRELGDCKVGFIGAGDIAQATMKRLANWGCELAYYKHTSLVASDELYLKAHFEPLGSLLATCNIVSIHVPVTESTRNMVNAEFLAKMRVGSILINTARGEIVDQVALGNALVSGRIAACGLDTISPEPVTVDNNLLNLPNGASRHIIFSPHIGGITEGAFYRCHHTVWSNIARIIAGEQPTNIVS